VPTFRCTFCGSDHEGPPRSYGFEAPTPYHLVPESERTGRVELGEETCTLVDALGGQHYFVRGNVEIPILGESEPFVWNLWVSLSEKNFHRALDRWEDPRRVEEPAYFGWLSTRIPLYPETLNLKTNVHTRPLGVRPSIVLEPTEHPLAVEQHRGITLERVQEIAELSLHPKR
jgi:hypothetical protein